MTLKIKHAQLDNKMQDLKFTCCLWCVKVIKSCERVQAKSRPYIVNYEVRSVSLSQYVFQLL